MLVGLAQKGRPLRASLPTRAVRSKGFRFRGIAGVRVEVVGVLGTDVIGRRIVVAPVIPAPGRCGAVGSADDL
jgi:hypothetical protein